MTTATPTTYTAGVWDIDPVHSDVSFTVRHMMVSKVRGRFTGVSGEIVTGATLADSRVTATIDASTIDTANPDRDAHIRSKDFFAVDTHPTWTFVSTSVVPDGDDEFDLNGDLTIKGVTRPVTFTAEIGGFGPDAYGGTRNGFTATTTISRADFGVDIAMPLEGGGVVVGDKITITLEIEGVLRSA